MSWSQMAVAAPILAALLAVLIVGWHKYAITSKPLSRALELYLWITPVLTLAALGVVKVLTGLQGMILAAIVHLLVMAYALQDVFLRRSARPSLRLAGSLLMLGAVAVWLGAITYVGMELPAVATQRANHLFTAGGFLIGALLSLAGFTALSSHLRDRGDAFLSQIGLGALLIGTVCWIFHLAFRATVMVAVARDSAAVPPDWYQPLRLWAGAMYVGYMILAYLSIAAFGAALGKNGLVGKWWSRAFVAYGMLAAAAFVPMPLMVQPMPYAMGMILLRRAQPGDARPASDQSLVDVAPG